MNNLSILSGTANIALSESICTYLEKQISKSTVSRFPDGETIVKIDENVRGKECFVIQPTCSPVNDNIMELLIYIDCLKRASAKSITAVIPYFGYARQDRKSEGRTPITAKMVSDLITKVGADRILTMDLHANQIEGFFNIPVDHLKSFPVLLSHVKKIVGKEDIIVLSPDVGNMKIAEMYAKELNVDLAVINKKRINGEEAVAKKIIGDVRDKHVIMFDDMISTAGTICSAASLAKDNGSSKISVFATHGLFVGAANDRLKRSFIDEIYITDTVPFKLSVSEQFGEIEKPKIKVISVANLIGEAILRIYQKRSVSVLLRSDYENNLSRM